MRQSESLGDYLRQPKTQPSGTRMRREKHTQIEQTAPSNHHMGPVNEFVLKIHIIVLIIAIL